MCSQNPWGFCAASYSATGSPLPWDVERPLASFRWPVRARGCPRPDADPVGRSAALKTVQWPPWAFSPHDPSADRGEKTCCIALLPSKPPARSTPAVTRLDPALHSRRGPAPLLWSRTATVEGVLDSCPSITDASAYSVAVAPPPCSLPRLLFHGPVDSRRRAVCLYSSPPLAALVTALCACALLRLPPGSALRTLAFVVVEASWSCALRSTLRWLVPPPAPLLDACALPPPL